MRFESTKKNIYKIIAYLKIKNGVKYRSKWNKAKFKEVNNDKVKRLKNQSRRKRNQSHDKMLMS